MEEKHEEMHKYNTIIFASIISKTKKVHRCTNAGLLFSNSVTLLFAAQVHLDISKRSQNRDLVLRRDINF